MRRYLCKILGIKIAFSISFMVMLCIWLKVFEQKQNLELKAYERNMNCNFTRTKDGKHLNTQMLRKVNSSIYLETSTPTKPVFAIAIFSRETSTDKRKSVRETWLAKIGETPFDIKYKFILDRPTPETEKERQLYQDIIYTNMSAALSGYAVCFSTRMLKWYKYAVTNFPKAELIGKMDDDVYPCVPQLFERIFNVRTKRLYYGWKHGGNDQKITRLTRVDEMTVVLGRELVDRILKRKYCGCFVDPKLSAACNKRNSPNELASDPFADMAIAMWLSQYNDVDRVSDNGYIAHFSYEFIDRMRNHKYAVPEFCVKNLIFHKSSVNIMYKLHHYNMYFRAGNKLPSIQSPPVGYSRPVPLTLSTFIEGKPFEGSDKFCDLWIVLKAQKATTSSFCRLLNVFTSRNWCVVIIGDESTPDKNLCYEISNRKSNVVFLPPQKHEVHFPAMSDSLFWNHIGRRNIGFLYAMHHGAKYVFDFYYDARHLSCVQNVIHNFSINSIKSKYAIPKCGGTIWSCAAFKVMALPITVDQNSSDVYRRAIANFFFGNMKNIDQEKNVTLTVQRTLAQAPDTINKDDIKGIYLYLYMKGLLEYDDVAFSYIWTKSVNITCV